MNKLFLIGNGFDLAHGLKTRYSDFLLWYLNEITGKVLIRPPYFEDGLVKLELHASPPKDFCSITEFNEFLKGNGQLKCKNDFFKRLIDISTDFNWVDIEYEYYKELRKAYDLVFNDIRTLDYMKDVNDCLKQIKEKLIEYLQTIKIEKPNRQIENHFFHDFSEMDFDDYKVLYLNFNYTNTIDLYSQQLYSDNVSQIVINIHGEIRNPENPIIFGYGDEMDEYYSKIENLNINEFLENMKSFGYHKTRNYKGLKNFLDDDEYKVSIMGHSCGLSDRVLLNSIFCNKKEHCKEIRIFYYLKPDGQNDFIEKTMEISRHFPLSEKDRMRNIIVPLEDSTPLIHNKRIK